jgi:hypothetical protein|nr:MAG TPA: hypothetical protein [Caudoviricetes sp.]
MTKLQKQLKVANRKAVEAISKFDDTANAILYLRPTGEGAKDSVKQELKEATDQLVCRIKELQKLIERVIDEE